MEYFPTGIAQTLDVKFHLRFMFALKVLLRTSTSEALVFRGCLSYSPFHLLFTLHVTEYEISQRILVNS